jgi:hypothetical protein
MGKVPSSEPRSTRTAMMRSIRKTDTRPEPRAAGQPSQSASARATMRAPYRDHARLAKRMASILFAGASNAPLDCVRAGAGNRTWPSNRLRRRRCRRWRVDTCRDVLTFIFSDNSRASGNVIKPDPDNGVFQLDVGGAKLSMRRATKDTLLHEFDYGGMSWAAWFVGARLL